MGFHLLIVNYFITHTNLVYLYLSSNTYFLVRFALLIINSQKVACLDFIVRDLELFSLLLCIEFFGVMIIGGVRLPSSAK